MMAFQGNNDKEQETRLKKLDSLDRVKMIQPHDLQPEILAQNIVEYLQHQPAKLEVDLLGATSAAYYLRKLVEPSLLAV